MTEFKLPEGMEQVELFENNSQFELPDKQPNTGQRKIFTTMGSRNYARWIRDTEDFYASERKITDLLIATGELNKAFPIWEPCCGTGDMAIPLMENGYTVRSTDLIYRGFGEEQPIDFLKVTDTNQPCNIVTNPPYKNAQKFVEKALDIVADNYKVCMFLKVLFLEGQSRKKLFLSQPPTTVYVSSSRLCCARNADFETFQNTNSAIAYAWFIWRKGYSGDTIIKWIN